MAFEVYPLPTSFLVAGIVGFLFSVMYIAPALSLSWGIAFAIVFLGMIAASFYAMQSGQIPDEHLVPEFHRERPTKKGKKR